MDKTEFMTGYEVRLFKGWEKTASDLLKDEKMLANTLKKQLGFKVEETLETGEVVNVPVIDLLILKKIGYDLANPKAIDLKVYSTVLGESKQEVNVVSESATDVFKGVVAGAKNDTDTRPEK